MKSLSLPKPVLGRVVCGAVLTLLSGCGFTMGQPEFSCSGLPEKGICMNAWDTYAATNDRDSLEGYVPVNMEKTEQAGAKVTASQGNSEQKVVTASASPVMTQKQVPVPLPPGITTPVRSPAKVMRIWFAPYEDEGALIAPSYVFSEVQQRRWMLGLDEPSESKNITPLKVLSPEKGL
ncbi:MAG: type IV conjugative transfer system lipoprotein TraV [Porticoccaceae bacterium]